LKELKRSLPELETLLKEVDAEWVHEDGVYRFYHQSFKVYALQHSTLRMTERLQALLPERPLNSWLRTIVSEGTGKKFDVEHNSRWLAETRPIVEAFFHSRYFLQMAVRNG